MTKAFVLMTAMPPTKGHRALITFAAELASQVEVIVCTQPGEPFAMERNYAVGRMIEEINQNHFSSTHLNLIHKELPQEPAGREGFWDMWIGFLEMFGFQPGDMLVASERYGRTLAEHAGAIFMPFDIERQLNPQKATWVRGNPLTYFDWIDDTFQRHLMKTITVFGAESTGKTTLSKELALRNNGHWLFEYARPYLENTSTEITVDAMTAIWHGQRALQDYGWSLFDKPFVFQDTDLFSTIGYWNHSEWGALSGTKAPSQLEHEAINLQSDLYIITQSNIPFEHDALRYGGDHREIPDQVWVDLCEHYELPYVVLDASDLEHRCFDAGAVAQELFFDTSDELTNYTRNGAEYERN